MTPQQLESAVLAAVEAARAGVQIEDDRLELKRQWPEPTKARQLAAAANRRRGEELVYIIGLDGDGTVHPTVDVDAADWWTAMSARFDQLAPDLVQHLTVPIGDDGTVVALVFDTSRTPYVVRTGRDGAELEVPIRDGSRTRSAHRHEILRMLTPALSTPTATIIEAQILAQWNAGETDGAFSRPERLSVSGSVYIFIEPTASSSVFLPAHRLRGSITQGNVSIPMSVQLWHYPRKDDPPPPRTGLEMRADGVAVMGPGAFRCHVSADPDSRLRRTLAACELLSLDLCLDATGASRPVSVSVQLVREAEQDLDRGNEAWAIVGRWSSEES